MTAAAAEAVDVVADDQQASLKEHDPTCDLFDRLNSLKNDEELMDLATGFVLQLLRTAQEEALRRGHVPSKVFSLEIVEENICDLILKSDSFSTRRWNKRAK